MIQGPLKIVGGKGVCILGYANFSVRSMQLVSDKKIGAKAFAYPKEYAKPDRVRKIIFFG